MFTRVGGGPVCACGTRRPGRDHTWGGARVHEAGLVLCCPHPPSEAALTPFRMISSSVLGPAVTFRVSPNIQNVTMADVAKAAGKTILM